MTNWRIEMQAPNCLVSSILIGLGLILLVLNFVLLALSMARFKRARLIHD
jgi:hypothetical protein